MKAIFLLILSLIMLASSNEENTILETPEETDEEATVSSLVIKERFESALQQYGEQLQNPGLKTFGTQKELNRFKKQLEEAAAWLKDQGEHTTIEEFRVHFVAIQNVHSPIVNKSFEYRDREETYNKSIQALQEVYQQTQQLNQSQPWVSEKTYPHLVKINATKEWIKANYLRQKSQKLNDNILFYNHQMISSANKIQDQYEAIRNTPNPQADPEQHQEIPQFEQPQTEQSQQATTNDL